MRFVQPNKTSASNQHSKYVPDTPCPGVEALQSLVALDDQAPSHNTIYFLSDIRPVLESSSFYDADLGAHNDSLTWVICAFINGRDASSQEPNNTHHLLSKPSAVGSILVANGSTPRSGKEQDYHDWYDREHGAKLANVPGWVAMRRYSLEKVYGDVETASFYGLNYYDEDNGLGGPEWQAGVTEWTMRIRSNAAKANVRRVWRLLRA